MEAINIFGPTFDACDSYGRIARELSSGFRLLHRPVNKVFLADSASRSIRPTLGGFILGYPSAHHKFGAMANAGKKIAITMFESTKIPWTWIAPLNDCAAIIVPSHWLVDVFRLCGVTAPIHVVPLGVSPKYKYKPRSNGDQVKFLAIADRWKRKGWHHAAYAFYQVFGDDPKYQLVLKTRRDGVGITLSNPNIQFVSEDFTEPQLVRFYQEFDFMLFPACGEGFGLPPREFAATGGVPVATNWGGTADDLHSWGVPLDCQLENAWQGDATLGGQDLGQWAAPRMHELMTTILQFKTMPLEERNALGLRFSNNVRKLYSWREFAKRCLEIWDSI